MAIVKDKYRGKIAYHQVYNELIIAARYRGTVTYQELAQLMELPLSGSHMGHEVGQILGEISEDEQQQGRPMLSAVAVGVSGEPGEGFYAFARDLGKLQAATPTEKRQFWEAERAAVYETWRRRLIHNRAD